MTATTSPEISRYHVFLDGLLRVLLVLAALTVGGFGVVERWRLASTLPWQTDELPLLLRYTGVTGQVASEEAAREFIPTPYLLRTGALRALQPPKDAAAVHTTANFWTNLSIYFGGVKPWVARVMPFAFAVAAMVIMAYATRAVGGGLTATVIAVGLVALSPLGILYAAQARGYAEAIFLTPLLLLCLDALRRHPRNQLRAALVLVVAVQLSLTVYTMWIYWVLPIMLVALIWLPQAVVERENARQVRFTLGLSIVALVGIMGVYTLDRWSALTYTAGHMGDRLSGLAAALDFAGMVARGLTPLKELVAIPAFLGMVLLLRSHCRWWGLAIGFSLLVPLAFAFALGTAGYARNFAYLVCPVAMLAGLGIERFLIALLERRHRVLVHATAAVLLLAGMLAAWEGTVHDVRSMILPNWGGVVQALSERPETVGPRWISACLTHHWPINWYQGTEAARKVALADEQQPIELVVGTTLDAHGVEIVYKEDVVQRAIVESPAPEFITSNNAVERMHGVNVRRWLAQPVPSGSDLPEGDVVWIQWMEDGTAAERWGSFLSQWPADAPLLNFKPVPLDGRLFRNVLVAAPDARTLCEGILQAYAGHQLRLRMYALTPISGQDSHPAAAKPKDQTPRIGTQSKHAREPLWPQRACLFNWDHQF